MSVRKLLWLALGYAGALLLANYLLPDAWLLPAGAALLLAGLGLLPLRRRLWAQRAVLALLAAGLGFGWVWGCTAWRVLPAEQFAGQERSVTLWVTDWPEDHGSYVRLTARSVDSAVPHGRMLIYDYDGGMTELRPGDVVETELKLLSAGQQYGEDSDYYRANGILLRGYRKGDYLLLERGRLSWLLFPKTMAKAVKDQALRCFPGDVAGLMKALLTGDKAEYYLDDGLYTAMQSAGFSHIVAVSGMHVGFLVTMLRLLTRRRRITAFVGIPAVLLFIAMIGFTPSVTRAGVMQILLLLAPLLRREEDAPSSLAAALLLILLPNPLAVGNLGLQFSFTAMAGLILLSPRVYRRLTQDDKGKTRLPKGLPGRALRWLCAAFASSLGALAFTTPLSALHFGYVPVYGLLTNLLCLWMMSGAFLLGYPVCLLGLVWPGGGAAAGWAVAWLPRCAVWVVKRIARLPYAVLYTRWNLGGWWLCLVYALFLVPWLLLGRRFRPILPLCGALLSFAALTFTLERDLNGALELSVLDVGQGQSIAVLTEEATVVIDCGSADYAVNAGDVCGAYLAQAGRRRVVLLILTHFHGDHVNGVRRLLSRMQVDRLAVAADYPANDYAGDILAACAAEGTEVYAIQEDSSFRLGGLVMRVYAPIGAGDANDECLLICGDWGDYEFLVTGDAGGSVERMFAAWYPLEDMELLVAGHHGSRTSTTAELLDAVTPETVVVSCGTDNAYGHPNPEVLERLEERNISVRRTDMEGTVTVTVGGIYGGENQE